MKPTLTLLTALLLAPLAALHAADAPSRSDIILADFEQGYGDWTVQGEAFKHPTTRPTSAIRILRQRDRRQLGRSVFDQRRQPDLTRVHD